MRMKNEGVRVVQATPTETLERWKTKYNVYTLTHSQNPAHNELEAGIVIKNYLPKRYTDCLFTNG